MTENWTGSEAGRNRVKQFDLVLHTPFSTN